MDEVAANSAELECAVEEVMEAKQYLVDLDRRQHQFMEAVRALKKMNDTENLWILCSGRVFVKSELRRKGTLNFLSWKIATAEREIENGREELKSKVAYLAEIEGPDRTLAHLLKGFELKPS
ncbi:hypothetical protein TRVL_03714 [Trypanosoma vivax]|nr:hypothetical protein TRVL_03714 [Trypanosoma vivax]